LDIGVLGYIGIVQHKEHSPEVLSIPPGTPCIYVATSRKTLGPAQWVPGAMATDIKLPNRKHWYSAPIYAKD